MKEKIQIFVDGRPQEVQKGSMLLDNLRAMGIHIPTLCHHPSLEPNGECRLCVVEITHPDWKGWSNLVTSCLYPASPGFQVFTRSERVREARRTLLELYLAQYPGAEEIKALARNEGVDSTPFPLKEGADKCVLCGLCTRVCQELSVGAIAPLGRGTEKKVGPRPDLVGEDCTACGACDFICPTGHIQMEQKDGKFLIWNREFDIPLCAVAPERCRGCGICEEVCPWDIPRVIPLKTGAYVSYITPSYCKGCGICAGACPTGAIRQEAFSDAVLSGFETRTDDLKGRAVVFACSRSPLPPDTEGLIRVPCIGRVGLENILECLARGADGVMMMCRDQATCPSGPGGERGEKHARVADALCASAGLGTGRIQYTKPESGLDGPARAIAAFKTSMKPSPLQEPYKMPPQDTAGLDRAVDIMHWFRNRLELTPVLPDILSQLFSPADNRADTLLYLGDLPDLNLLLSLVVEEWRLTDVFEDAAELLRQEGIAYRPVLSARQINESDASRIVTFCSAGVPGVDRNVTYTTLDELAGNKPLDKGADTPGFPRQQDPEYPGGGKELGRLPGDSGTVACGLRFQISQKERQALVSAMTETPGPLRCACPHELAQYKIIGRKGAWQETTFSNLTLTFSEALRTFAGDTKE